MHNSTYQPSGSSAHLGDIRAGVSNRRGPLVKLGRPRRLALAALLLVFSVIYVAGEAPARAQNATGAPAIGGVLEQGLTVAADITGISDSDGLTYEFNGTTLTTFTYQWLRVEGGVDTVIDGATEHTYLIHPADVGKKLKLRVVFDDDASNSETRTSAASATVARASHYLVSNLGQNHTYKVLPSISQTALGSAPGFGHRAQAFTTGGVGATLTAVRLRLGVWPGKTPTVSIYSDVSSAPGTSLATLTPPANPDRSTDSVEEFTHSGLSLAANTTYWVVIDAASGGLYILGTV